jgi:hypothetical protein
MHHINRWPPAGNTIGIIQRVATLAYIALNVRTGWRGAERSSHEAALADARLNASAELALRTLPAEAVPTVGVALVDAALAITAGTGESSADVLLELDE